MTGSVGRPRLVRASDRVNDTADGPALEPLSGSGDGTTAQAASVETPQVFISRVHKANFPAGSSIDATADEADSAESEADKRQRSAD